MDLNSFELFDDELFKTESSPIRQEILEYTPKLDNIGWFFQRENCDIEDRIKAEKHKIDYYYYCGDFRAALKSVDLTWDLISISNNVARRDALETKVRCYIHLKEINDAQKALSTLFELPQTNVSLVGFFYLSHCLYKAAGNIRNVIYSLQRLLLLQSDNPQWWLQLALFHKGEKSLFCKLTPPDMYIRCFQKARNLAESSSLHLEGLGKFKLDQIVQEASAELSCQNDLSQTKEAMKFPEANYTEEPENENLTFNSIFSTRTCKLFCKTYFDDPDYTL